MLNQDNVPIILKFYNKQGFVFEHIFENKAVGFNYFILKDLIIRKYSNQTYFIDIICDDKIKSKLQRIIKNFINDNTLLGTSKKLNNKLYANFEDFN
jgi:hypothetical protein